MRLDNPSTLDWLECEDQTLHSRASYSLLERAVTLGVTLTAAKPVDKGLGLWDLSRWHPL